MILLQHLVMVPIRYLNGKMSKYDSKFSVPLSQSFLCLIRICLFSLFYDIRLIIIVTIEPGMWCVSISVPLVNVTTKYSGYCSFGIANQLIFF